MKTLKRMAQAACLAAMCMMAVMVQAKDDKNSVERIDLTEIGVDSATQSQLSDSTVVALTRMAIEHKERVMKLEAQREEQMANVLGTNRNGVKTEVLFIAGIFPIVIVVCLLIYMISVNRIRRRREEAKNAMLLNLVSNGQALTPELVEAITNEKEKVKKVGELTMYASLRKFFLGGGLLILTILFVIFVRGNKFPINILGFLVGIFYAAQGLAGYLTLKQEKQDAQQSETE